MSSSGRHKGSGKLKATVISNGHKYKKVVMLWEEEGEVLTYCHNDVILERIVWRRPLNRNGLSKYGLKLMESPRLSTVDETTLLECC